VPLFPFDFCGLSTSSVRPQYVLSTSYADRRGYAASASWAFGAATNCCRVSVL
jgi:hypothetical protein